jgi:hypothetical protein
VKKQKVVGLLVMCAIGLCSCSKGKESVTREAEISRATSAPQASNRAAAVNPRVTGVRQETAEEIEVNKLIENVDKDLESQKAYPFQEGRQIHKKARLLRLLHTYTYKEDARNKHIIKLALNRIRTSPQKTDRTETLEEFFKLLLERETNRASANPKRKSRRGKAKLRRKKNPDSEELKRREEQAIRKKLD